MSDPGSDHPFGFSLMREPGDDSRRRLRPAPMSSLFEIAFRIIRRHWAVLLGLSILLGLPGALLGSVASIPFGEALLDVLPEGSTTAPVSITEDQARSLGNGLLVALLGGIVAGILAAIATVGFAWVVARDYHGRRVTLGDTLGRSLRRAVTALIATFLVAAAQIAIALAGAGAVALALVALAPDGPSAGGLGVFLAIVVGVAFGLAFVIVGIRWTLVVGVVAIEDVGPVAALRRSWHLTGEATWRTVFVLLLMGLITMILGSLVAQLASIVIVDALLDPMGLARVGQTAVDTIVTVLFAPVTTVVLTVYLYDQKVRRDGFDLPAA